MLLGPNLNPSFQASIPRDPAPKPFRLGNPEPQPRTLPATQQDTVLFGPAQNPQSRRNLHDSLRPSQYSLPHRARNMEADAQQDTLTQHTPGSSTGWGPLGEPCGLSQCS